MDLPVTNDLAERAARRRGARAAALAQPAVPVVELRDLSMVYPGGHVGLDSLRLSHVEVEHAGTTYRGRGVSTDSVEASAKAFLNANFLTLSSDFLRFSTLS